MTHGQPRPDDRPPGEARTAGQEALPPRHLPLEPDLPTHAALVDLRITFPELIAQSEGGDETETLLRLWTTLTDCGESADDAIAFVGELSIHRGGIRSKIPSDTLGILHILLAVVFSQELFFAQDLTVEQPNAGHEVNQ